MARLPLVQLLQLRLTEVNNMSDIMDLNGQENELQRLESELEIPVLPENNVDWNL